MHTLWTAGVMQTANSLGGHTNHQRIYRIIKPNGLIVSFHAKARKRKWVRYGRFIPTPICSGFTGVLKKRYGTMTVLATMLNSTMRQLHFSLDIEATRCR